MANRSNQAQSSSNSAFTATIRTWRFGSSVQRAWLAAAAVLVFAGMAGALVVPKLSIDLFPVAYTLATIGLLILYFQHEYWKQVDAEENEGQVSALEEKVRENPQEPTLAWDLARLKLERYLDRNISQVSAIFYLILLIMIFGMILISVGVGQSIRNPSSTTPPLIAALAGIIVQFIGGTFLIVYRSTMDQAKNYVVVLERINAVGMSINVLESIESSDTSARDQARAQLARDLMGMYGIPLSQSAHSRETGSVTAA